jgi:uncharacterized protein
MRLGLQGSDRRYFALFDAAAENVADAGRLLHGLLAAFPANADLGEQMRACEQRGDGITRDLITLLNSTLVTPFDRDDLFALASAVDDVVDHLDEAADALAIYGVREVPPVAVRQAAVAEGACAALAEAVRRLDGLRDVATALTDVREHEREGDRLVRTALADLFDGSTDPLIVIRWKDIHEAIEHAINAAERAAAVIDAIQLKSR